MFTGLTITCTFFIRSVNNLYVQKLWNVLYLRNFMTQVRFFTFNPIKTGGGPLGPPLGKFLIAQKPWPEMVPSLLDFVLQSIVEVQANFRGILLTRNIFFEFFPRPGIALAPKEKTVRFIFWTSRRHISESSAWIDLKFSVVTRGYHSNHRGVSVFGHAHFYFFADFEVLDLWTRPL